MGLQAHSTPFMFIRPIQVLCHNHLISRSEGSLCILVGAASTRYVWHERRAFDKHPGLLAAEDPLLVDDLAVFVRIANVPVDGVVVARFWLHQRKGSILD